MPLIIVPKTTKKVVTMLSIGLDLKKVPKSQGRFWHGNFNDSSYTGLDGKVDVLFTGYSGAVAGQAILEYASLHKTERPEVYFIGSAYAFSDSPLEPGDIIYAKDTFSPDSYEQQIYLNALARHVADHTKPDPDLQERVLRIAQDNGVELKSSKIYCTITPGYLPHFSDPSELMNEAMWWKLSLGKTDRQGCDTGEYESASVLSTCRLLDLPAVALLDIKDKRYDTNKYKIASDQQKRNALSSLLGIIQKSIIKRQY